MDQGVAIVIAAVFGALGTVAGVFLGGRISASSAAAAAKVAADATTEAAHLAQAVAEADREEARSERRRATSKEAARAARRHLLAATALFSDEAGVFRGQQAAKPVGRRTWTWLPSDDSEVEGHTKLAIDASIEVVPRDLREFVARAAQALSDPITVGDYGGPPPWVIGRQIADEADGVFGAYLRDEALPPTPETDRMAAAIDQYWSEMDQLQSEAREERAARQRAAEAGKSGPVTSDT